MFKITTLQNFTYYEENLDKGGVIREKALLIGDLLVNPQKLDFEREQARQYRVKFYPGSVYDPYGDGYGCKAFFD